MCLYRACTMSDTPLAHNLLVRELNTVTEWDVLGIYLGLEENEIQVIKRDNVSTARRQIVMLDEWLKRDVDASWEKVIDSLKCMSQIKLADELKKKYTTESNPPALAAGPMPAESSSEKELIVGRQELIAQEIEDLEESYLLLVTNVHCATAEANPSLIKLQTFSKYYSKTKMTTVEELFDLLEPFDFLDHTMLEKIVKFFLCRSHPIADDLRDYRQQLAKFKSSTTVKQFMDAIEQAQQSQSTTSERQGLCTVKLRLVGGWLVRTMEDLEKLVNEIFREKSHVLSHLKIVRGSVIVTYYVPLSEVESLLMLALEQSAIVIMFGVNEIVVGSEIVVREESPQFTFENSLIWTVKDNDLNLLKFLLSINTSPDATDSNGWTALLYAIFFDRQEAMSLLLKANANPNLQLLNDGSSPIFLASQHNRIDAITQLLEAKADPNLQRSFNGATPLIVASEHGHTDAIALLLKANADPNLEMNTGATPLFLASEKGNIDVISLFLKANADPNIVTSDGATPLYMATQNRHIHAIRLLLEANASPNLKGDSHYASPLYLAAEEGYTDAIDLLLNADADPNYRTFEGTTPLYVASQNNHTDVVTLLLNANNVNPNLKRDDGATPLHMASQNGHTDNITLLLNANANPDVQASHGATPLSIASDRGHTDAVSLLLKAKASPNLPDDGAKPLHSASDKGYTEIVSLLLKANANPNLESKAHIDATVVAAAAAAAAAAAGSNAYEIVHSCTPLFAASQNGHTDVIDLLLKANANPNLQADNGATPLYIASQNCHAEAITLLLEAKGNPDLKTNDDASSLFIASQYGHTDVVTLLLNAKANPNLQTEGGTTPLMVAALNGHPQVVQLLLTSGADPNRRKPDGVTALMLACRTGCLDSVELLLMSGADPDKVGPKGLSALDIAAKLGHEDIVDLLQALKPSQSSTTSPVLTIKEIASTVPDEIMTLVIQIMELVRVKKVESCITTKKVESCSTAENRKHPWTQSHKQQQPQIVF